VAGALGPALAAALLLQGPSGIAVAPDGRIFIVDAIDHRIVSFTSARDVRTFPGTAVKVAGLQEGVMNPSLNPGDRWPPGPHLLALDADGNVYTADPARLHILKLTATGAVTVVCGSGKPGHEDGPAEQASFTDLTGGMDLDNLGNLYVTDADRVRRIRPDRGVETLGARFEHTADLAASAGGVLYVADDKARTLWRVEGDAKTAVADAFDAPVAVDVGPDGALYVADAARGHVYKIVEGKPERIGAAAAFRRPCGIAVDPRSGTVYVMDDADRGARGRRTQYDRLPRVSGINPAGGVAPVIDPGGPQAGLNPYDPDLSGSRVPVWVGAAVLSISVLALGVFFWRHRKLLK
jgi:DNA-binding beta-propeller fold protein YncE